MTAPRAKRVHRPVIRKTWIATVETTHFVDVQAVDLATARRMFERTLLSDFGPNRHAKIIDVEEA